MKSKGKFKPSLMPEGKEADSLCLSVGSRAASYRRKRYKGKLTNSEASHLQTSRPILDSCSENADNKEAARVIEIGSLSEREQLMPSTTTEHLLATGNEEVVESEVSKCNATDKIRVLLNNVEEQPSRNNTRSCHKHLCNDDMQIGLTLNTESPSSIAGGRNTVENSANFKDVERAKVKQNEGASLCGQLSSGDLDREKSTLVLEFEAIKGSGDGISNYYGVSKAIGVDMSTEVGSGMPPNGAITISMAEETNSDSEISVESQDVKICDICGDAGQEESLAVCSRCCDGAEHTYCMRVRLDEIPEGDWICEGCKLKEETGNLQLDKSEAEDKTINEPCSAENSQGTGQTINSGSAAETICTLPVVAGNMKELLSTAMSTLRKLKKLDSSSTNREKTTEAACKPTNTILRKNEVMVEENSINGSGMMKPEPFQSTTCDKSENICGQQHPILSDLLKIQSCVEPRGTLSKTSSFNSSKVPKVKPLLEDFPQMQKIMKEPYLNINKRGLMQTTTKLPSFKSTSNNISCTSIETVGKMESHNSKARSIKQIKEINTVDNRKFSSLLNSASDSPVTTVGISSKDIKPMLHDGKLNKPNNSNHSGSKMGLIEANASVPTEVKQAPFSSLINRGSKSHRPRDAVELARVERSVDSQSQSVEASASNTDKNSETPAKHVSSTISNLSLNILETEVTVHAQVVLGSSCADPMKIVSDNHIQPKGTEIKTPVPSPVNSNRTTVLNVADKWSIKPNLQISVEKASFLSQPFQALIIPEHEYIWQGMFLVLRTGKHPRTHDGFQAHLSTVVSTKAIEVTNMFPSKLQLEEVPRKTSWPLQFKENSPKEDNIALFFFAKDITSYKYHYQKLVENMLKNDLALRGNINDVELLIFPSNVLPKGYQQWNTMIFLWGIFKEKGTNCTVDLDVNKEPSLLELNVPNFVEDISSHTALLADSSQNTTCESTLKGKLLHEFDNGSLTGMELQEISFSRTEKDRNYDREGSHFHTKSMYKDAIAVKAHAEQKLDLLRPSFSSENISNLPNSSIPSTKPKIHIDIEQIPVEEDEPNSLDKLGDSETKGVACSHAVSAVEDMDGKITEQKVKSGDVFTESVTVLGNDLLQNLVATENISWRSRLNLKRAHSSLGDTNISVRQTLEAHVESRRPDNEKGSKKNKVDNVEHTSNFCLEDNGASKESLEIQSSLSALMSNSTCRSIYPESSDVSRSSFTNKDSLDSNKPDLELVLGGNNRLAKQVNILVSAPKMPIECNHDKLLAAPVNDFDDESGSLALSLAFHESGKMKKDKSVANTKQLFPDKPHIG